jgi:hypothetical protein
MFRNCVALEKDPEQVNYIKMRIQGIWDCPDQDQEVGAKHINETERFQMTSREPMEPIDEDAGDLVDLEDVIEFEHMHGSAEQTINATEDNLEESIHPEEPTLPDLLID